MPGFEKRLHVLAGLWRQLNDADRLLDYIQVGGVMTLQPYVTSPDTPLLDAARMMLTHRVGGLPVVERGHLVGILTESDILTAFVTSLESNHGDALHAR